jgi:iron complex transport system substrate-binding protein
LYHVDAELIDSLKPDLLITQQHCEVCAVTPAEIERAGCAGARRVLALQAGSVRGIFDDIFSIGRALGRDHDAANLVGAMSRRMSSVHNAVKHRRAPDLVALEWTDPVFAMGNWGPELVEAANGRLMLSQKGGLSHAIDWQIVRAADPEWLIIAPCGFDLERATKEVPAMEARPGWFDLRSVREGNVALADGNTFFNRSGTSIVETVEILAEILHGYPAGHRGTGWVSYAEIRQADRIRELHARACANNSPTYIDPVTGYEVFTADFLSRRGECCRSGCRHCPYASSDAPGPAPLRGSQRAPLSDASASRKKSTAS